jgi:hypothetical protein
MVAAAVELAGGVTAVSNQLPLPTELGWQRSHAGIKKITRTASAPLKLIEHTCQGGTQRRRSVLPKPWKRTGVPQFSLMADSFGLTEGVPTLVQLRTSRKDRHHRHHRHQPG